MANPHAAEVNAAAEVLDPWAFQKEVPKLGCGGPWHYEGHSFHSGCPVCGSREAEGEESLRRQQTERRVAARKIARRALRAAARTRAPTG